MEETKGNTGRYEIKEAESIEILIIVDNYVDLLLPDSRFALRASVLKEKGIPEGTLLAEHGLCLLISVDGHRILFDTGYTETAVMNNIKILDVDLSKIEAIIISHFHMDHTGGLRRIIDECKKGVSVFVHPDAFIYPRYVKADGKKLLFPRKLIREEIEKRAKIVETKDPSLLSENLILVTGQIKREVEFEKAPPNLFFEKDGKEEKDLILDDQAIVLLAKGKGLVIISGCAHSGIINTVRWAKEITGIEDVYAIIGGMHLSGPFFEKAIEPTIEELKKINPKIIVPMHCTGWKAIKRISEEFEGFILASVGTRILI